MLNMEELKKIVASNPDKVPEKSKFITFKLTGIHKLKLTEIGEGERENYRTGKKEVGYYLTFDESGEERKYFIPTYDNDGKFNYLVMRFRDIEIGQELIMEYKPIAGTPRGYIDIRTEEGDGIPVINEDVPDPDFE